MRKAQGCKEKRKPDDDRMARVLRALRESMRGSINRRDPIMEQLRQCPEAFKVGEILGKAFDSLKYAQDGTELARPILTSQPALSFRRSCDRPAARRFHSPGSREFDGGTARRWDEGPAAALGMSLLRLGICRPNDWSGSAVDFVERGFRRFCSQNRAAEAKRVWVGDLRITDSLFELTEQERNQVEAGREGMTRAICI